MGQWPSMVAVIGLTVISGALDARGFVYASQAWPGGQLDARLALAAIGAFVGGLSCYVLAVRFMQGFGVTGVALQSGLWFGATAIGLALMDASIASWTRTQQLVGLAVALGLGWLIASTSAANH